MEKFSFEGLEFFTENNNSADSSQGCVAFSKKLLGLFKSKAKESNNKKITSQQISNVFCSAVENFEGREDQSKSMNQWCLARVNGFLRILSEKSVKFTSKNSSSKAGIDATSNWQPSEEDFVSAQKDIESNDLQYGFSSVDELYIKEGVAKYWFEV